MRARDFMNPKVISVAPDETLADLESLLLAERIGGVPVVEGDRLVGIVSRSDIVRVLGTERALAETQLDFQRDYYDDPDAPRDQVVREMEEDAEEAAEMVAGRMARLRVRDAMNPSVVTVDAEAPVRDVAARLVEHRIHRLVVTEAGRLAGIVTALDLVRLVAEERLR